MRMLVSTCGHHEQQSDCHYLHACMLAVWQIVEAIDTTLFEHDKQRIANARFYAVSCDEASSCRSSFLCCHVYVLEGWRRHPIFLRLKEVRKKQPALSCIASKSTRSMQPFPSFKRCRCQSKW